MAFWLKFGVLEGLERSGRKIAVMCPIFVKNAWWGEISVSIYGLSVSLSVWQWVWEHGDRQFVLFSSSRKIEGTV